MRATRFLIYLWVFPTTLVGVPLLLGSLFSGGRARCINGVLEVHGGLAEFYLRRIVGLVLQGGASAMTLGHIVIGLNPEALETTRSHERVHVRQCECWGPFFIPAYLLASAFQWARGRRAYRDNPFERQAYEQDCE